MDVERAILFNGRAAQQFPFACLVQGVNANRGNGAGLEVELGGVGVEREEIGGGPVAKGRRMTIGKCPRSDDYWLQQVCSGLGKKWLRGFGRRIPFPDFIGVLRVGTPRQQPLMGGGLSNVSCKVAGSGLDGDLVRER